MSKKIDMTGRVYGRLTVVSGCSKRLNSQVAWVCECSCGEVGVVVRGGSLRSGDTQSCGCFCRDRSIEANVGSKRNITHGMSHKSGNSHYTRWKGIRNRTGNPNQLNYKDYGGRGITLHHEWIEAGKGFERFKWYLDTVLGPCPEGSSLDRIDNDGNYEPWNLRWATRSQQVSNRRVSNE